MPKKQLKSLKFKGEDDDVDDGVDNVYDLDSAFDFKKYEENSKITDKFKSNKNKYKRFLSSDSGKMILRTNFAHSDFPHRIFCVELRVDAMPL